MTTVRVIIEVDGHPIEFPMLGSAPGDPRPILAAMLGVAKSRVEDGLLNLAPAGRNPAAPQCTGGHAEPDEMSYGFGGITYACGHCGDWWFERVKP